jgi:hypothetical protein
MTVLEAVTSGTYRDVLVALRHRIARAVDDGCAPRDLVGLSRRLVDLAAEIEALDARRPLRLLPPDEAWDPEAV